MRVVEGCSASPLTLLLYNYGFASLQSAVIQFANIQIAGRPLLRGDWRLVVWFSGLFFMSGPVFCPSPLPLRPSPFHLSEVDRGTCARAVDVIPSCSCRFRDPPPVELDLSLISLQFSPPVVGCFLNFSLECVIFVHFSVCSFQIWGQLLM